jgi:hypothetical protein
VEHTSFRPGHIVGVVILLMRAASRGRHAESSAARNQLIVAKCCNVWVLPSEQIRGDIELGGKLPYRIEVLLASIVPTVDNPFGFLLLRWTSSRSSIP